MKEWPSLQLLLYIFMLIELIAIAAIDVKHQIINSKLLYALFFGGVIASFTSNKTNTLNSIAAMFIVFAALGTVYYFAKNSIGLGDVKLCSCIALYLGIEGAFTMIAVSMFLCGIAGVLILLISKSYKNKVIPYAPFAALSTFAVLLL